MKIKIEISEENETTAAPYWLIIDPKQMMKPDPATVAAMITGPFFSRLEAETVLSNSLHNYSDKAVAVCQSGCLSLQYQKKWREAESKINDKPTHNNIFIK